MSSYYASPVYFDNPQILNFLPPNNNFQYVLATRDGWYNERYMANMIEMRRWFLIKFLYPEIEIRRNSSRHNG